VHGGADVLVQQLHALSLAETYPVQLVVESPEIEPDSRDNREVPIAASYSVAIPDDILTLSVS
jgi:hypothetical protein